MIRGATANLNGAAGAWASPEKVLSAFALSLAAHVALIGFNPPDAVELAASGDSEALIEAFGNSFADLASGIHAALPPADNVVEPVATEMEAAAQPVQPDQPQSATAPERATMVEPLEPQQAAEPTSEAVMPEQMAAIAPLALTPAAPLSPTQHVSPSTAPPSVQTPNRSVTPDVSATSPREPVAPVAPVAPVEVTETIEALDVPTVPQPIDTAALRPAAQELRQRVLERERERREAEEIARPRPTPQSQPGSADRDTRRGTTEAQQRQAPAQAPRTQPSANAPQPGAAAVSNYPGQVYRRIQRTRQRSPGARGTARIRFSISGNGSITAIRVSGSSGVGSVDQAALDHVRRAAPFPAPPRGAQTTFVVPITFR